MQALATYLVNHLTNQVVATSWRAASLYVENSENKTTQNNLEFDLWGPRCINLLL